MPSNRLPLNALRLLCLPAAFLVAIGWNAVRADVAPDPLSGGKNLAVKGREKTNVAMVDEVVKLRLSKDACHVDVVFTMKNTGDKAETMQVGFPSNYAGELKEFKAAVDDKAVKASDASEDYDIDPPDAPRIRRRTTHWKLWEMTFPPEKPVKIAVSYRTKLEERATWTVGMHPISHRLGELATNDEREALEKQLVTRHVEYILKTGGHWSGPIGRCRIEVTFEGMTSDNMPLMNPHFARKLAEVMKITRDKVVIDLKDFEPEGDIGLAITPEITRQATQALLENFHERHPHDPAVTEMLAEYLIAADRKPDADRIVLELLKHWQSRVTIWGPGSEQQATLGRSIEVFSLLGRITNPELGPVVLGNPREFAPVIEQIANRLKSQLPLAPPARADAAKSYAERIEKLLEWCRKHAKPE